MRSSWRKMPRKTTLLLCGRSSEKEENFPNNDREWWVFILAHRVTFSSTAVPHWHRHPLSCYVEPHPVRPCQHCVRTPFIISAGIRGLQVQSHGSSACQQSLSLGLEAVNDWALANIPFSQRPSPARIPTCPSGLRGPAQCCCRDPRASWWAADDPCSAAPGRAPPSPPRQNTTPERNNGRRRAMLPSNKSKYNIIIKYRFSFVGQCESKEQS